MEPAEPPVFGPGYCRVCGRYGRGRIVDTLNDQADAIASCESCQRTAAPIPAR